MLISSLSPLPVSLFPLAPSLSIVTILLSCHMYKCIYVYTHICLFLNLGSEYEKAYMACFPSPLSSLVPLLPSFSLFIYTVYIYLFIYVYCSVLSACTLVYACTCMPEEGARPFVFLSLVLSFSCKWYNFIFYSAG